MRETLKSLSIFSAMLMLLLLISSGCDVTIPWLGKRSLPFFKKIVPTPVPTPSSPVNAAISPAPTAVSAAVIPVQGPTKQPTLETSIEMSISKPKATATSTFTVTATPTALEVEKIAYITYEKNKPALWMMNTDGSEKTRLTPAGTGSWFPLWSPNGKILAFLSDMKDGNLNLFILKKGSIEATQLTFYTDMAIENPRSLKPPFTWSPKSDEISYVYHNQVWKVELDTLNQVTLASADPAYSIVAIEWAPHRDTKFIAYLIKKGINFYSVMLVNPRLMDQLSLVDSRGVISDITWSPDARRVAYLTNKNAIYTASPDTSIPKMILWNASPDMASLLTYSPVESTSPPLLCLAKKDNHDKGYRVALTDKLSKDETDPGTLKYLTEPGVTDAIWSPDGSKIAYVQNGELWVMDATTGNKKTRLAASGIEFPNWSKK